MARTNSTFCPFKSIINYLLIRPYSSPLSPLFLNPGDTPFKKNVFDHHLKQVLIPLRAKPYQKQPSPLAIFN